MRHLILLGFGVAALAVAGWAEAGWGGGICAPVGVPAFAPFLGAPVAPVVQPAPEYVWSQDDTTPGQWNLHYGAKFVGSYDPRTRTYLPYVNGRWQGPAISPIAPPESNVEPAAELHDGEHGFHFGLDRSKLPETEQVIHDGKNISFGELRRQLMNAGDGTLVDDSAKQHLTVIARDAATKKSVEEWMKSPEFADLAKQFRTQVYDASNKAASLILAGFKLDQDKRFQESGVAVCCQEPADVDGMAAPAMAYGAKDANGLKVAVNALRKTDPKYDPNKVVPAGGGSFPVGWLIVGAAALFFFKRNSTSKG